MERWRRPALSSNKRISQEELGKALESSHAAISDIERGKTDISVKDLIQIAKFFNVSFAFFLEETHPNDHPPIAHFRDAKNITPKEKEMADKVANDFINFARTLAKTEKEDDK